MYYELTDHFIVAASPDDAWAFFSQAENLPRITPPWLRFTNAMSEPVRIQLNSTLDYTIHWAGIPIRWRSKIIEWSPPTQFIDLQIRGPYTLWHHQHTFKPAAEGVECFDRVIYKLPVPGISRVVHALAVKKQLLEIFQYRRKVIGENLGWVRAVQEKAEIRPLR